MSVFRNRVLITVALFLSGCGTGTVSSKTLTGAGPTGTAQQGANADDVLTSAVYQMRPENFSINSTIDKPVSLLNSWRIKLADQGGVAEQPVPVNAPAGWVVAEEETRLAQPKFEIVDAVHIRDALLYHAVAGYLSDRGRDESQRVSEVVDFICRNIALWKDDEVELPLRPFMSLLLGRGSADDRAWVCAEILRQLRIDSMILRAKSDVKETSEKWLFGVIIENKVRLYDLRLGLPLASSNDPNENRPATLDEIAAQPELLEKMSAKEPYRLTADDLRDPVVSVISDSNFWCKRMSKLERVLPPSDFCIIYDPPIDNEGRPGLIKRIASAGGWPVESLKLWNLPRKHEEESNQLSQEGKEQMERLASPLVVPIPYKTDDAGNITPGAPERKLQRIRTDQLLGKFTDATQRYLGIRHLEVERNPPEIDRLNRLASENALYWTALCKLEVNDNTGAVDLLTAYLKKYDRKGVWFFPSRKILAQSQAQLGQFDAAIATLERSSSEDPYRIENALRLKRWTAARK